MHLPHVGAALPPGHSHVDDGDEEGIADDGGVDGVVSDEAEERGKCLGGIEGGREEG